MSRRTLFQSGDWPMPYDADPLDGWLLKDVEATSSGPATADVYGKLYYHVRGVLASFLCRISDAKVSFRLFHMDASEVPKFLEKRSFSRIEV